MAMFKRWQPDERALKITPSMVDQAIAESILDESNGNSVDEADQSVDRYNDRSYVGPVSWLADEPSESLDDAFHLDDATQIGEGRAGTVVRCTRRIDGKIFAVKQVEKTRQSTTENQREVRLVLQCT